MKYNPALDGVRALAVIVVVALHSDIPFTRGGMFGVDVFFVLSGYLITTILRNEIQNAGRIDLKRFYVRRAARLMPALVVSMAGTFAVYSVFAPHLDVSGDIVTALLYVSDYGAAFWSMPDVLKHTWSLSVEGHFYVLWPLFLIATKNMTKYDLLKLLIAMFVVATAWRCADLLIWDDWDRTYYRFDTRLSGMIMGSILAVGRWRVTQDAAQRLGKAAIYILAAIVIGLWWKCVPSLLIGTLLAEIAAAFLIVSLTSWHQTPVAKALAHPWLAYIGVLSYSIYLWHYGFAFLLRDTLDPASTFMISLGLSILLSALSHRLIEGPVRGWANRSYSERAKPTVVQAHVKSPTRGTTDALRDWS